MAKDLLKILEEAQKGNIAQHLDEKELTEIGYRAYEGYMGDEESRSGWKERVSFGMDLAMQITDGPKDDPFEGAANVKYPLLGTGAMQYSARALSNLIPSYDIVKGRVIGKDDEAGTKAAMAQRVAAHMNWQLNEGEIVDWEGETDRLLTVLPILGCCFRETYWSVARKRIVSQYVSPLEVVMHYKAKSMVTVPRITRRYDLYPYEIEERIRANTFRKFDKGTAQTSKDDGEDASSQYAQSDELRPHLFLQQHTYIDLDGDDYPEPYVVTIHYDTKKIVRIMPRFGMGDIDWVKGEEGKVQRIEAQQIYTRYIFMPSFDGSIYGTGFGTFLSPLNEIINSLINQLLDAGSMANSQTGFINQRVNPNPGKASGFLRFERNEMKSIMVGGDDLKKNIVMLNEFLKEPSEVLFSLLGFIVQAGEKYSSVGELMMGEQSIHNEPLGTSLARLEEGGKVFTSINRRVHNSLKQELKLIYALNAENLESYQAFTANNSRQEVNQADYDKDSSDIILSASPEDINKTARIMKDQALLQVPGLNTGELLKRYLEDLQIVNPDELLKPMPPPKDPKDALKEEELAIKRTSLEFEMEKYQDERELKQLETWSKIIKNIADAEAKEQGPQLEEYKLFAQEQIERIKAGQKDRADAARFKQQAQQAQQKPAEAANA